MEPMNTSRNKTIAFSIPLLMEIGASFCFLNCHLMNFAQVPENPEIFRINARSKPHGFAHTHFPKAAENTSPMEGKKRRCSPSYGAKRNRRGLGGGPAVAEERGSQAH